MAQWPAKRLQRRELSVLLKQPYRCDYCPHAKGETNHWWMRDLSSAYRFVMVRWNEQFAGAICSDDTPLYEHICSEACASKALSKWMAEASGNSAKTQSPDARPSAPEKVTEPSLIEPSLAEREAALQAS
jgi:hypothetical protein